MSGKHGMDWESIPDQGTGNIDFLRLESGSNQVRVVGKPSEIQVHWEKSVDGSTKKVLCLGVDCPLCKVGRTPTLRYQVQVIDRSDGNVKVLEGGKAIFNAIKAYAVDQDYGDPTMYDLKIKKEGVGRDTRYTVVASPKKTPLTDDENSLVEEAKTLEEINKAKNIDEIMELNLEALLGESLGLSDDWGSSGGDDGFSDDDWNSL